MGNAFLSFSASSLRALLLDYWPCPVTCTVESASVAPCLGIDRGMQWFCAVSHLCMSSASWVQTTSVKVLLVCREAAAHCTSARVSAIYPLVKRVLFPTVQTSRGSKPSSAVRTNGSAFERIEWLPAQPTLPVGSPRWRSSATRTGIPFPARQPCYAQQFPRVLQPTPAIHQHENGNRTYPEGT